MTASGTGEEILPTSTSILRFPLFFASPTFFGLLAFWLLGLRILLGRYVKLATNFLSYWPR